MTWNAWTRSVAIGFGLPLVYLLPLLVIFYGFWGTAVLDLGRVPIVYRDGGVGNPILRECLGHLVSIALHSVVVLIPLAGLAAALRQRARSDPDRVRCFLAATLTAFAVFASAVLWIFAVDPLDAFNWYLD